MLRCLVVLVAATCLVVPQVTAAQSLTGSLIGAVKDEQGGLVAGALVRLSSPALLGGPISQRTNDKGQLRFPSLPAGSYLLEIEHTGFATYREGDIRIGLNSTIERTVFLSVAGVADSVVVEGAGSRIDARDPGFATRFGADDIKAIPTRRASMFDFIRTAPGVSPTSPSGGVTPVAGITTTVSAFGSGTNENVFLLDGTNFTCPCSGVARAEPVVDFIQEIHVQSVGASAEFGNVQGAVINVVTRQGGDRFLYDAGYYAQSSALTSQPFRLPIRGSNRESGYERARYRDLATNLGGPILRDRLWFFTGYQYRRDYDSQPGTDPAFPRKFEQDKLFTKLTWRLAPNWQLVQSVHNEFWVDPNRPTSVRPFETTTRLSGSVPAITFGHLTHTLSSNTFWDVRVGRFVYSLNNVPSTGDRTTASRSDLVTGIFSGGPPSFGRLTIRRTTAKATFVHYQPGLLSADHEWKIGGQVERGGHDAVSVIPTGASYTDRRGAPFQRISRDPSTTGGLFNTASLFVSDAIRVGSRLTINAGLRFDYTRAISNDLPAIDGQGRATAEIVRGLGTLYTWSILSPRAGVTMKLNDNGRTVMKASYGRFSQGALTGEFEPFHPGVTPTITDQFDSATGGYTTRISVVDSRNLLLDRETRAPRTDEYSVGIDREVGRLALSAVYVRKSGSNFIGWTDVGGQYQERSTTLTDGRNLPVFELVNNTSDRRFLLTNPKEYSLNYNGLVLAVEKRQSATWQAFASYTLSKASGLQAQSGTTAAGPQSSTVGPPTPTVFGRDPNSLTNARGRLANDRPHIFRVMGSLQVPRARFTMAANFQYFSGKPWAATTQIPLRQGNQTILLEPRGSRRLSSQTLLDLRIARTISFSRVGRVELLIDVLNALNDTAEEDLATDNFFSQNFGQPSAFVDPRRAMLGVRLHLGR